MKIHCTEPLSFDSSYYTSFPYLCPTNDGDIVVAYRQASTFSKDAALANLTTHHDPNSWICTKRLKYLPEKYSLISNPELVAYNGPFGVNDPAITLLRDGTYLMRFVALNIYSSQAYRPSPGKKIFSHRVEHGLVTEVAGQIILSSSNLSDWTQVGMIAETSFPPSCSRDPIVELEDESLIMPAYIGAPERSDIALLHRSFDKGKTWDYESYIAIDQGAQYSQLHGTNYNETCIVDLGHGHLVAAIRGDKSFYTTDNTFMAVGGVGHIFMSFSHDGGLCWSQPIDTGLVGQPANLIKLRNNQLLMTYGQRKKPYGIMTSLSHDFGKTWSEPTRISPVFDLWDCGYPSSMEMVDGNILSVYYGADTNQIRGIYFTIWSL